MPDVIGGFPKIRGTLLGIPIIRTIVFGELYGGSPYFGKLPSWFCMLMADALRKARSLLRGVPRCRSLHCPEAGLRGAAGTSKPS